MTKQYLKVQLPHWRQKSVIYLETLGSARGLLHGLDISFKGHSVITFQLRKQISVDTTFDSEDFVFEWDNWSGQSILEGRIRGHRGPNQQGASENQFPITRWIKLENCQWAFGEEKVVVWFTKFGKMSTPLQEEE